LKASLVFTARFDRDICARGLSIVAVELELLAFRDDQA